MVSLPVSKNSMIFTVILDCSRHCSYKVFSETHQHFLQTARIFTLSLPLHHFLETDSVAQAYELLANIYFLEMTSVSAAGGKTKQT